MYWSMCRGSSVSIRLLGVFKLQNIAFLSIVFEGVFLDGKLLSARVRFYE